MVQNNNSSYEVAEVHLHYNSKIKPSERAKVGSSLDSFNILKTLYDPNTMQLKEEVKVLLLNRNNRVLGVYQVASGGVGAALVDAKLVFATALKANASAIIISHNHPSGNLKPSKADIALTQKLVSAGSTLDIGVLDHIIITSESYYSFADEGMI